MRFRVLATATIITVVGTTALCAQSQFQGIITLANTLPGELKNSKMYFKGGNVRVEGARPQGILIGTADGRVMSVVESERMYMVIARRSERGSVAATLESLGKSEVIAGMSCSYYRIHQPGGQHDGMQACVTQELGYIGLTSASPVGDLDPQRIREQFPKGFFILKSVNAKGRLIIEVAKVERTALSDDLFRPPPGYTEVTMPGRGRPPHP